MCLEDASCDCGLDLICDAYERGSSEREYVAGLSKARAARRCFCQHAAAVSEAELKVAQDEERGLQGQLTRLMARIEAMRGENETLRMRHDEDERKKASLERLVGPTGSRVVHERGSAPCPLPLNATPAPPSMSIRSHIAGIQRVPRQQVALPTYRDRVLEGEVAALQEQLDAMLDRGAVRRAEFEACLRQQRATFSAEHAGLLREAEGALKGVTTAAEVSVSIQRKALRHRMRGMRAEEQLENQRLALQDELRDMAGKLERERVSRAAEMETVIAEVKCELKTDVQRLNAEQREAAAAKKEAERVAAEQREADDERITSLTATLTRLSRQCRRVSAAKHYEMQGLASEVGILRNDLKMLECHLRCHKLRDGNAPSGGLPPEAP